VECRQIHGEPQSVAQELGAIASGEPFRDFDRPPERNLKVLDQVDRHGESQQRVDRESPRDALPLLLNPSHLKM